MDKLLMNKEDNNELETYYNNAIEFTKSHYENFPVISLFITKKLRKYTAVIYQFARLADDIADEGSNSPEKRLEELNEYDNSLKRALHSKYDSRFWNVVCDTIEKNNLSTNNFFDLLAAFKQDVTVKEYVNYDGLLSYCKNSANPVGRLILELHGIKDEKAFNLSDKICTALQLTNFYQDVSIDILKDRIYLPNDEMKIFKVDRSDLVTGKFSDSFVKLMKYQVERSRKLFHDGRELLSFLPVRLRLQILVTIKGGEGILNKIEEINYNVLEKRPTLSKIDFLKIFVQAIIFRK